MTEQQETTEQISPVAETIVEKTLNQKLALITASIGAIPKTKKPDSTVKYAFRSIDDVMNHLSPALAEQQVSIINTVLSHELKSTDGVDKYGNSRRSYTAIVHIKLGFTDGKETEYFEEVAMSEDYADKAITQAMSMAYKYAILRKFCIVTADIADGDGREPERTATQPQQQEAPKNEDNRAWLNEKQFITAKQRMSDGELELFDKLVKDFRMKKEYRIELETIKNNFNK